MSYIKHFGEQSKDYLQFRPTYPQELYDYLFSLTKSFDLAVDCATGNGQAALQLANRFKKVIAIDINQEQLAIAPRKENIEYKCTPVEKTDIPADSVDLITVAQALHWFHLEDFYNEVKRIGKKDCVIAAWTYSLGHISTPIDAIVSKLYSDLGHGYWPKERKYIDEAYRTIPFPFKKFTPPPFTVEKNFNFAEFIGYLNTWSAIKEYKKKNNQNPIDLIYADLQTAWGNHESVRMMRWPLHLLVGIV